LTVSILLAASEFIGFDSRFDAFDLPATYEILVAADFSIRQLPDSLLQCLITLSQAIPNPFILFRFL
jgi:hypothetical protein